MKQMGIVAQMVAIMMLLIAGCANSQPTSNDELHVSLAGYTCTAPGSNDQWMTSNEIEDNPVAGWISEPNNENYNWEGNTLYPAFYVPPKDDPESAIEIGVYTIPIEVSDWSTEDILSDYTGESPQTWEDIDFNGNPAKLIEEKIDDKDFADVYIILPSSKLIYIGASTKSGSAWELLKDVIIEKG
jgi:hypothetical protein